MTEAALDNIYICMYLKRFFIYTSSVFKYIYIYRCGDAKIRVYMKESNDEVTDEIMTMHKEASSQPIYIYIYINIYIYI